MERLGCFHRKGVFDPRLSPLEWRKTPLNPLPGHPFVELQLPTWKHGLEGRQDGLLQWQMHAGIYMWHAIDQHLGATDIWFPWIPVGSDPHKLCPHHYSDSRTLWNSTVQTAICDRVCGLVGAVGRLECLHHLFLFGSRWPFKGHRPDYDL